MRAGQTCTGRSQGMCPELNIDRRDNGDTSQPFPWCIGKPWPCPYPTECGVRSAMHTGGTGVNDGSEPGAAASIWRTRYAEVMTRPGMGALQKAAPASPARRGAGRTRGAGFPRSIGGATLVRVARGGPVSMGLCLRCGGKEKFLPSCRLPPSRFVLVARLAQRGPGTAAGPGGKLSRSCCSYAT